MDEPDLPAEAFSRLGMWTTSVDPDVRAELRTKFPSAKEEEIEAAVTLALQLRTATNDGRFYREPMPEARKLMQAFLREAVPSVSEDAYWQAENRMMRLYTA